MHITTEKELDGPAAKQLREAAGLTQKDFWTQFGVTQSGGSRYEQGQQIPKPLRILIFASYVAGVRLDASSATGAAELARLAKLQASQDAGDQERIGAKWIEATALLKRTSRILRDMTTISASTPADVEAAQT